MAPASVFPSLHSCTKVTREGNEDALYDVKFFPYATEGDDAIFAAVGGRDVFICRPLLNHELLLEVLRCWQHDDPATSFNSVVWAKDPTTQKPLLIVGGASPRHITILDVESCEPIRTLRGHGKAVNDLAISPTHPNLLASASEDHTIRLWNLDPEYENQPCVAIFAGEGHRLPLIAAQFHQNGRWLISGGFETEVCLWAVPSTEELKGRSEPLVIYYPHFRSSQVHHNYVDTLTFYGDLILSRAARDAEAKENEILLWKIEGFDSNAPPPKEVPIPEPGVYTRSAFGDGGPIKFRRLLTFSTQYTDRFYHRFSLLYKPDMRPILCMGNQRSRVLFWDLQKLEEGIDPAEEFKVKNGKKNHKITKSNNSLEGKLSVTPSQTDSVSSYSRNGLSVDIDGSTSLSPAPEKKLTLRDPFTPLAPHATVLASTNSSTANYFSTSNLSWSPDGTWLVGVGDHGMICVLHRDSKVVSGLSDKSACSPEL